MRTTLSSLESNKALGPPPGLRLAEVAEQCDVASPVRDTSVPSPSLCHTDDIDQLAGASAAPDESSGGPAGRGLAALGVGSLAAWMVLSDAPLIWPAEWP